MSILDLNVGPRLAMDDGLADYNGFIDANTWASNKDLLPFWFTQFYWLRLRKHYFKWELNKSIVAGNLDLQLFKIIALSIEKLVAD